jgi:hypothetical protein
VSYGELARQAGLRPPQRPDDLDTALKWMDTNTGGRPYGVDVVMPATVPTEGAALDLDNLIPDGHRLGGADPAEARCAATAVRHRLG